MKDARTGLTLAELLIALFISGTIMAMLATALGGFSHQSRTMAQHRQDVEDRDDLIRAVRLSLQTTLPLILHDKEKDKDQEIALFSGTSSSLHILTRQARWPTPPGLYEMDFEVVQKSPNHWQVELYRQKLDRLADFAQDQLRGTPAIVYDGAREPSFAFVGIGKPQDKWQLAPKPPSRVILLLDDKPQVRLAVPPGVPLPGSDKKPEPKPGEGTGGADAK